MNKCELVYNKYPTAEVKLLQPYLEKTGVRITHLDNPNKEGMHGSGYVLGEFEGKPVGIRFGRQLKYYEREAGYLSRLSHPGIPKSYAVGELKTAMPIGTFGYMIVNHFSGTTLRKYADFSSEEGRKKLVNALLGVVDLLDYIHSQAVVHQDVIPEHILVDGSDNTVALLDFHSCDDIERSFAIIDQIQYDASGFGMTLGKLLPFSGTRDPFIKNLRDIANCLTGKSAKFIEHPKSRDFISDKLKKNLEDLLR